VLSPEYVNINEKTARHEGAKVMKIELLLNRRLVRDSLSFMLTTAGFSLLPEADHHNDDKIAVIDIASYRDPNTVPTYQQRGTKIVVLASKTESLELSLDEIAPLSGLLTHELSADAFIQSLWLVCSGERVLPLDLVQKPTDPAPSSSNSPPSYSAHLTARERELLLKIVEGQSNKAIARYLCISEATVKVYLKSVLRKIRVDNRTQAAIWALANLPEINATPHGFV
jgi:DNA-binding NarL/FixJ family response regulator